MIYKDPVYGKINIQESVILELISSGPVKRLKKITQHGPSVYNKYYKKKILTRFEHSLGVYILLNRLQVSLEEQIAGLLHDVGHTVFSHTIDFLFPEENHEYDKKFHKEIIENSEIPKILKKYKIDIDKVLDLNNFLILERDLPNLCTDRIDYFLRDPFLPKNFDRKLVLDNLIIFNNKLAFLEQDIAFCFSSQYLKMNKIFWAHPLDEFLYFLMVDILKYALTQELIRHEDLFLNEEEFLEKIRGVGDSFIDEKLKLIENIRIDQVKVSKNKTSHSYFVKSKIRVIDPLVLFGNKCKRLSLVNTRFKKFKDDFCSKTETERWIGYEI